MSKQLDWLAEEVLATFAELGFDAPYIADKRNRGFGNNGTESPVKLLS
jgi:hypothetical protein